MSAEGSAQTPAGAGLSARERAERKRRLAEIFGDVLPEQTRDDTVTETGETNASEEWLKRQVPPHHG